MADRLVITADPVSFLPPPETVAALRAAIGSGSSGTDIGVEYTQAVAAANWGPFAFPAAIFRRPDVTVFDAAGNIIGVDPVVNLGARTVTIAFPFPIAGSVVLN